MRFSTLNSADPNLLRSVTRRDGSRFTVDELRDLFLDELAKGHEVIPVGECDNFDHKKGCRGHLVEA